MQVEDGKKYKTRDGQLTKLVARVDGEPGPFKFQVILENGDRYWVMEDGYYSARRIANPRDLITLVPDTLVTWIVVVRSKESGKLSIIHYKDKEGAVRLLKTYKAAGHAAELHEVELAHNL